MTRLFIIALFTASLLLTACAPFQPVRDEARSTWELNPELTARTFEPTEATLYIGRPEAVPALATSDMAYRESTYERRYYARNRWVDEPARLLHPLLVTSVEDTGLFRSVLAFGGAAPTDYRLDSELLVFEHDYTERDAGMARVVLRARLVDTDSARVLATRRFRAEQDSQEAGPGPGVAATNRATAALIDDLLAWLNEEIRAR